MTISRKCLNDESMVPCNFQALEEAICEITECENITTENEFFDLYEIKLVKRSHQPC